MIRWLGYVAVCLVLAEGVTSSSTLPPVETTPDNATYRDVLKSQILAQHVRYCGSNRLCEGYRPSPCWWCAPCQCDAMCSVYDDCCPDKTLSGVAKPPVALPPMKCMGNLHGRYTDEEKVARLNTSSSYFMVTSCPADADAVLTASCADSPSLPPVTAGDSNVTYLNKHCAACHGVHDVREWKTLVDCTVFHNFQKFNSTTAVLDFALDQEGCWVVFVAPPDTSPRQCYQGKGMISACNVTGKWSHYDEMLEQACHSYTTVKEVGAQTYRNVFCYICNSENPVLFSRCKKRTGGPVSFSALLDFSSALYGSGHDPSSKCTVGQLYDGQRDSCRDILCSQGKQLLNQTCVPIFGSAKGLGYELYFDMESAEELPLSGPEDLLHSLPARLKDYFPYTLDMLISFHDFVVAFHTTDVQGHCSQSTRRLSIYATFLTTKHIDPVVFESMLLDLRSTNFTLPTETRNISFETMPNENVRLISQTHKGRVHKHTSCVISVSMSNPYQSDDPEVEKEPDSSDPFSTDLVLIRVSNLLPCPQILLEKDEYVEGDSMIQLDWLEDALHQGDFEEDDGGWVKICLEHFKPDALLVARPDPQASEAEIIVSIIFTVLSLVCLLLTFITYCLFKTLRAIPGKNNMNLTITLFAAQLLYLVGSGKTETKGLCEAMGIFIHYLWLSVFCAMAVCSFHMFRVFTTLRNREDSSERRRKFLQYCVFIYGVPATLVVATLVVHIILSEGSSIGYGGSQCYLSSGAAIGIAFGIPVAVTVLVNLVFFILTIKPIRNRPKVDKNKQDEHHVLVYIKLSSLTGITWILGFVAFAIQWQALRYLFIIVNASQGVFLFISFVCNCRVVRLFSGCCCDTKKGKAKANAASSSTSTTKAFTISKTETKLTDIKDSKS